MRTRHLLAAFVLPAVFSACSQDELVTNNAEKEVVGTPIGYLEFTASRGSDITTRLANNLWEEGDKIGMGWISDGETGDLEAKANLYSNHPLYYKTGEGSFKSETMIYEGLYIASFPFQEGVTKIAPLEFDLEKQKSEDNSYSKRWYVSKKILSLTEANAGLGQKTSIELVALTNGVRLHIVASDAAGLPDDFKVTGVKLTNNSTLTNKITFKSSEDGIAADAPTLNDDFWDGDNSGANYGNISVTVGEEGVGTAIDAANGLDVYIQMGKFTADETTLTIQTNYGEASIVSGKDGSVTWSSTNLGQTTPDKVKTFAAAIGAAATKATELTKPYGQGITVNVTLDTKTITANSVITNQTDLENYVNTLEKLNKLDEATTVTFKQSALQTADGVESIGDVIISDISPLNKIKGKIVFAEDNESAPDHVYIAGELALKGGVETNAVTFRVLNGTTLTVSRDLDLKSTLLTVNAGATLVNKAQIAASGDGFGITTAASSADVPAGLYISEAGASVGLASDAALTNSGAIEWKGGTLPTMATNGGLVYANVADIKAISRASSAFAPVTDAGAIKEIIISDDLTVATQLTETTFPHITKMTIKGNVTFNLEEYETPYTFSALTEINVESGSFNLTGGDQGTTSSSFCAFEAKDGCALTLAEGTKLNLAAGTKLDLSATGTVSYKGATVANAGYIVAFSATGNGASSWTGNNINDNPKAD